MKAIVSKVNIGDYQFDGYKLENNEYALSTRGLAKLVNRDKNTVVRFLQSDTLKALPEGSFTVVRDVEVQTEIGTVITITAISLDISYQYLIGQLRNGNDDAFNIITSLGTSSLENKLRESFGDVTLTKETLVEREREIISRLEGRKITRDCHSIFIDGCVARKLPAPRVHDFITKMITGWTAGEAKVEGELSNDDDNPNIGLNYQPDGEQLAWVARAKMKVISYRKGTWQERCLRAVNDTADNN